MTVNPVLALSQNYPFMSITNTGTNSPFNGALNPAMFNGPFLAQALNVTTFTTDLFSV